MTPLFPTTYKTFFAFAYRLSLDVPLFQRKDRVAFATTPPHHRLVERRVRVCTRKYSRRVPTSIHSQWDSLRRFALFISADFSSSSLFGNTLSMPSLLRWFQNCSGIAKSLMCLSTVMQLRISLTTTTNSSMRNGSQCLTHEIFLEHRLEKPSRDGFGQATAAVQDAFQ